VLPVVSRSDLTLVDVKRGGVVDLFVCHTYYLILIPKKDSETSRSFLDMDTEQSRCSICVYPAYPVLYDDSRRRAAVVVAVCAMTFYVAGLTLFILRRHERLISARNWILVSLVSLNTVVCWYVPYREYWGESTMPCALLSLFPNILFALVPSGRE
jgi:hypothetical protein